jgi:N-acetylmuramoyl-L-alanine amidase
MMSTNLISLLPKVLYPSPNYEKRLDVVEYIIIHFTDMLSTQDSLDLLCCAHSSQRVSAHFLIDEFGTIFSLVDPIYTAWHAGKSFWKGKRNLNHSSIGIELQYKPYKVKDNYLTIEKNQHIFFLGHLFPPYEIAQINSLLQLLDFLCNTYKIHRKNILGHQDIAPCRKIDPGPSFPWKFIAEHGFGHWPKSFIWDKQFIQKKNPYNNFETICHCQRFLHFLGYDCDISGYWDQKTVYSWIAYQSHWSSGAFFNLE